LANLVEESSEEMEKLAVLHYDWYGKFTSRLLSSTEIRTLWTDIWFSKTKVLDNYLREKYATIIDSKFLLNYQPIKLREKMALIVLFDQIPRNIFRGSKKAYSYDHISKFHAFQLLNIFDTLSLEYKLSIILCFIHSENLDDIEVADDLIGKVRSDKNMDQNVFDSIRVIHSNHRERITFLAEFLSEISILVGHQLMRKLFLWIRHIERYSNKSESDFSEWI